MRERPKRVQHHDERLGNHRPDALNDNDISVRQHVVGAAVDDVVRLSLRNRCRLLHRLQRGFQTLAVVLGQLAELHAVSESRTHKRGLALRDDRFARRQPHMNGKDLPAVRRLVHGVDETSADAQVVDLHRHIAQSGAYAVERSDDAHVAAAIVTETCHDASVLVGSTTDELHGISPISLLIYQSGHRCTCLHS